MALTPVRIPSLQQANPIVDDQGRMTSEFARRLNDILQGLGSAVNGVIAAQNAAEAAQTAASLAQQAADNAQAAADAAAAAAGASSADQSLAISGIMPRSVLSANPSGTITIAAHTRYYGNGASVAVNAGIVTGQDVGAKLYVFYDDANRTGGAVSYQADIDFASQTNGRHNVGSITIPTTGTVQGDPGPAPPGGA